MNNDSKIIIVIPIFNDWSSLEELLKKIDNTTSNQLYDTIEYLIINDGSFNRTNLKDSQNGKIKLINLATNLGHQKAIAIGLSWIHKYTNYKKIVIMDGDGEDKPEELNKLLEASLKNPDKIIVAKRNGRENSISFKIFYRIYRMTFRILTGNKITFGNFVVFPAEFLKRLVYMPETWSHLPSTIIKIRLPIIEVGTKRGNRLMGKSKMTMHSLLLHGFAAISVFSEKVTTRILMVSSLLTLLSLVLGLAILIIKYLTTLAIPGWTSTMVLVSGVIFLQAILLSMFALFLYLSSKSLFRIIPAIHFEDYIPKEDINE